MAASVGLWLDVTAQVLRILQTFVVVGKVRHTKHQLVHAYIQTFVGQYAAHGVVEVGVGTCQTSLFKGLPSMVEVVDEELINGPGKAKKVVVPSVDTIL